MPSTWLITGASRGLGLGYAKQILATHSDANVIGTARDPSKSAGLAALAEQYPGRVAAVKLEVTDHASVTAAFEEIATLDIAKNGIDVLVNNAGVNVSGWTTALEVDVDTVKKDFDTNVFGAIDTTLAAIPLLRQGKQKKIIMLGSLVGAFSSEWSAFPQIASYASSKAAIHFWTRKLGMALGDEWTVNVFSPGYVVTEMNAGKTLDDGLITVEEAAEKGVAVFDRLTPADKGKIISYTGEASDF